VIFYSALRFRPAIVVHTGDDFAEDMFPKQVLGIVAGFVVSAAALGGVVLGQFAGYLLDHGFSYTPVLRSPVRCTWRVYFDLPDDSKFTAGHFTGK